MSALLPRQQPQAELQQQLTAGDIRPPSTMTVAAARSNPETPKDSSLLVWGSFEEYSAQVHALKTNQMHPNFNYKESCIPLPTSRHDSAIRSSYSFCCIQFRWA
jgi:hypothetical protein